MSNEHEFRELLRSGLLNYLREWVIEDPERFVETSGQRVGEQEIRVGRDKLNDPAKFANTMVVCLLEIPRAVTSDVFTGMRSAPNVRDPVYLPAMIQYAFDSRKATDNYARHEAAAQELKELITWIFSALDQTVDHFDSNDLTKDVVHIKREAKRRIKLIEDNMHRAELSLHTTLKTLKAAVSEQKVAVAGKLLAAIMDDE